MADGYVKILSSILDSSIWEQPDDVRIVWITMLAMADRDGYVGASVGGIARRTVTVSSERVAECLALFQAPDTESRSDDFEGRRIRKVERGWEILNYRKFRDMHGKGAELERKRRHAESKRKNSNVDARKTSTGTSTESTGTSTNGSGSLDHDFRINPDPRAMATVQPRVDRFGDAMRGTGPGKRADVIELHGAWRASLGRDGAKMRSATCDDAYGLAEAIDAHGLADCLLVAKHAKSDQWVSGKADKDGVPHDSIQYIFGNENTFSRILAAAQKAAKPRQRELTATELKQLGRHRG